MSALEVVADGLYFGEGPRWHDGRLWLSDMHGHRVVRVEQDGSLTTVVEVPGQPSGLGWLPDGRMLVVSMVDRRVLRLEPSGDLVEVADLSPWAAWHCNDMVVDGAGRAYVGNFGWDIYLRGATRVDVPLILVTPDGPPRPVTEPLGFPNGTVITPDGATLIVGESMRGLLTAFTIEADGSLSGRRTWAKLEGATPDGICLDEQGAIWVASPLGHQVLRVAEGGQVLDRVAVSADREAFACMLGGDDRRTLFVCTASESNPDVVAGRRDGRVEAVRVEVAGAGWP